MSSPCYKIRAGHVTALDIPAAGLPVFSSRESSNVRLVALPGAEHEDWSSYTLDCVASIAQTMTPWATWYCSPDAKDGNDIKPSTNGMAYWTRDAVWMRTSRHPDGAIEAAFHEAFHCCEYWTTGEEIAVLRAASAGGR